MVVSKEFLGQLRSSLNLELIQAKHLQQIAKWCVLYYDRYREAPGENIEALYHAWVERGKAQEDVVDAVHDLLEQLSDSYEKEPTLNVPYLLDTASEYFTTRRIESLKDELEYSLTEGDKESAQVAIANFSSVSASLDMGSDPLNDDEAWDAAFAESQKPLISWGDSAADFFFGQALTRDSLIGVLAPEKRGKTWWCVEFTMRAVSQRRRVALFEVGDMSQSQIYRRLGVRLSRRPLFKKDLGRCNVPAKIRRNGDEVQIKHRRIDLNRTANAQASKKAVKQFLRSSGIRAGDPYVKVSVHSNSSVNVQDLSAVLDRWEVHEGFIPDIIIIDYPDILAPEPGSSGKATRDQVNDTWKAMRRLSQDRHCLVIAPTQADAASYGVETLDASNFSEDKRKIAHVTGMLGLNQTREEKARQIMRLNWIALRESEFAVDTCLHVGQCYRIGRPFCCACL